MSSKKGAKCEKCEDIEQRRGPWTLDEDNLLIHCIAQCGEGRWNLLARCSGLKRTGKSCRLRWLNYLKPDVKRGNLSPQEQFLILDLHSKWGNRWSRIAQYLPGRTDNEIKNYWRTRVQKQAKQLKIDTNSSVFRNAVRRYWMPRLLEKASSTDQSTNPDSTPTVPEHPQQLNSTNSSDFLSMPNSSTNYYETSSSKNELMSSSENQFDEYGLDALDLVPLATQSECDASGSDWADSIGAGLWSMDELWEFRKRDEGYGGGMFHKQVFSCEHGSQEFKFQCS